MPPATAASVPAKAYSSALLATTSSMNALDRCQQHALVHFTVETNYHRVSRTEGFVKLAMILELLP
jgi:hypothetical protein